MYEFPRSLYCVLLLTAACDTPPQTVQLNQGWSSSEIEFYHHASEGTNLAPLDFVLNLPDPARPGSRFVDKLVTSYGFIPSPKSELNPHGLPVGFAIDKRPAAAGDRVYLGITCSICHTRQLTYQKTVLPVHGGPALIDMPRFKRDFYDAFFALLDNDDQARKFAQGVLGKTPDAPEIAALRDEIREFAGPVASTRSLIEKCKIPAADFGPGNLNALSQGNYNNIGLRNWLTKNDTCSAETRPRFEGAANFPPMWFAPGDTWAQWFAEIHDPGPRNWVQSVSTSEVRPPKMIKTQGPAVILTSIHFDNIAEIQRALELLRTPKWPEAVLGAIDHNLATQGRALYEQHCASCHTRTVLPPNNFGVVFKERPAFDVGTDPTAYKEFAEGADKRVAGLKELSGKILAMRQAQLEKKFGQEIAANYMRLHSRGRPNDFALAKDQYQDGSNATWPKTGAAYWASPLEGIFASGPYFHNGSVRTLWEVLTPPDKREKTFRTGSAEFDAKGIGLRSEGSFVYDTSEPGKGNGGHLFGTDLSRDQKAVLIEYLKSL